MRAFFKIHEIGIEIEGVTHVLSQITPIAERDQSSRLPELQCFFETAAVGDVFQVQANEHIVALGTVTQASWLR
jgi:hypothetical protein